MVSQARQQPIELATHVPRLPRAYVPRARLWARLDVATESTLTLLVGPGGSGKTLGVSGWLRRSAESEESGWLHADATWGPDRLAPLLQRTASDGRPRLLVIDDAHLLPLATVRALDSRLASSPDTFRVLLIARWDLPFTRLGPELMGHLTVLRGELLRLDEAESRALVAAHVHTEADEVARAIAVRTQGWCAAVVLTARAVAAASDPLATARRYAEVGGSAVADRVASEVFATLQPRQRHLLLCVANEPGVTPALAVHLSHDTRADESLAELEAMGLLVTRVSPSTGTTGERFLIHPLLTEVVRRRLSAGGVDVLRAAATVRRAVQLDVARGDTGDAFRRLVDIGHHAAAATLLADHGVTLLARGHGARIDTFAAEHPSVVDVRPAAWFALALERWSVGQVDAASQWLDRIVTDPMPESPTTSLQVGCARLMRSQLGLESVPAAVEHAGLVLAQDHDSVTDDLVPMLLCELGATQNWSGDLDAAQEALTRATLVSRSHDLPGMTAAALSHLAMTEFMLGHENAVLALADEVLTITGSRSVARRGGTRHYSTQRAGLATALAVATGLESLRTGARAIAADDTEWACHPADLSTKFWSRTHRSRVQLARGSVSEAERALDVPLETPPLPDHLASTLDLERAFLASLSGDVAGLGRVVERLRVRTATGEAALAAGLRADLVGDRRAALERFAEAAASATLQQPPVRAIALVAAAQLHGTSPDGDERALELLHQSLVATEARGTAVPFLGWSRHGAMVADLLPRLESRQHGPWIIELTNALAARPGIAAYFGPTTARPGERVVLPEGSIRPTLSARERDVLYELARGSTYADIAANLFVSENTVKTHVSSLYAKLAVNRRSAALAAARAMRLL